MSHFDKVCVDCEGPLGPFDEDFCEWCEPEDEEEDE